jgi:hypothetical protein
MKLSARFSENRDALKQPAILLKPRQQESIILIGSESSRFSRGTVEQQTQVEDGTYSCSVLSSPDEIRSLRAFARRSITQNDILFDPEFFLSSVSSGWEPRVVAVRNQTELAGVVYAKEKIILGYHLGVVYADLSWGSVPFGDSAHQENTFRVAMEKLLASPGTRGIRLRILRGSPESAAIRKLIASRNLDVHFSRVKDHADLALPDTYEQLLQSFGSATRHNFRRYRRHFEAAGHIYLENLSLDELRLAAMYLRPRCTLPSQSGSVERVLDMVATADQVLAVGLKHRNGEWLGIIGGVYRPRAGLLLLQLSNDKNFPRDSLSVVLRGYLIETLIRRGTKLVSIWGGTSPPLSRYVKYLPTLGVHLDLPGFRWRLVRRLVTKAGPWLPKRFGLDAQWIAPFRNR